MRNNFCEQAESIIGYEFANKSLLECALTHKSYANEYGGESNGRLEYLGDSVLNMLVAELLYNEFPDKSEGELTDLRQKSVSETPLAEAVKRMGLMNCYRLGKGAKMSMQSFGDKPTSDVFESVLGAVYLDGGLSAARDFVHKHLTDKIEEGTKY